jgi:hypothetical protein
MSRTRFDATTFVVVSFMVVNNLVAENINIVTKVDMMIMMMSYQNLITIVELISIKIAIVQQ